MESQVENLSLEELKEQNEHLKDLLFESGENLKAAKDQNHYFKLMSQYRDKAHELEQESKTLKEQLAEAVGLLRYVQHPKNTDEWVDCGKEVDRFLEKQDKENKE